jgi:hypothetical protein
MRKIIGVIFVLLAVYALKQRIWERPELASLGVESSPAVQSVPEAKTWQEVGRKVLIDESVSVAGSPVIWYVPGAAHAPADLRVLLEGQFASSDPSVKMLILDQGSWGKLQNGFPPLSLGSAGPDAQFRLPAVMTGYYFGFFPQAPKQTTIAPSGSIALRLLDLYQEAHPAPIRVTAHVESVIESFCTDAEAQHEREVYAKARTSR